MRIWQIGVQQIFIFQEKEKTQKNYRQTFKEFFQ